MDCNHTPADKDAGNTRAPHDTDSDSWTDAPAPATESGSEQGAPASNTAPYNSNVGQKCFSAPSPRLLRLGVDSLYLSYAGELSPEGLDTLHRLKTLAQSEYVEEQSQAQYPVPGHVFIVNDKGERNFPYVLEDAAYRIKFSRSGKKLPMAYVKVSAYYLAHRSLQAIQDELQGILLGLGVPGAQIVSRIDLAADFSSHTAMDGWPRSAWVTRAVDIDSYSKDQQFTGWMIGKGGALACRLYDKVKEIEASGKTWLWDLWAPSGYVDGDPAWRLEFQLKRDFLKTRDLHTLDHVKAALGALWTYCTHEWLRLTVPNEADATRSRWPTHTLWTFLSAVDWNSPQTSLERVDLRRIPSQGWLRQQAFGLVTTTMALHQLDDANDAVNQLLAETYAHYERVALRDDLSFPEFLLKHARKKARLFSTLVNRPGLVDELRERYRQDEDNPYRKASRGE